MVATLRLGARERDMKRTLSRELSPTARAWRAWLAVDVIKTDG